MSRTTTTLTGTQHLLGLVLRRDRVRLAIWVLALSGLTAISTAGVVNLYATPADLAGYAELVRGKAAMIVQSGPGHGLDHPAVGAVLANEMSMWSVISVALMSIFMVTRHTRTEEETERAELVRAGPVGRHAAAAAAMAGVSIANMAVATGVVIALLAYEMPVAGALAFGAAMAASGMVFAGLALVMGQVASSARAANGSAAALVGVAFAFRAIGDVSESSDGALSWLSWLSPIGWAQSVRPFAVERWWVLAVPLATTAALVVVADWLTSRRDLGAGLIPQRPGPATAGPRLSSTFGLAARLHRGSLIGWSVGLAAVGFFYGAVAVEAEALLTDNPEMADFFAQLGEGSLTDVFLATALLMLALIASGYTVSAVLRLRSEEADGRVESLLSAPVPRRTWIGSHLLVAVVGSVIVISAGGAGTGIGFAVASGDAGEIGRLIGSALTMVPAMLVLGGVAAALFGVLPRWAKAAWVGLAVAVVVGLFAELMGLPGAVRDVSPFTHLPAVPAASVEILPLVVLTAVAGALTVVGLLGLERRDLG
ncbi:exporter of polyketide antibiotics [soil metagenome]